MIRFSAVLVTAAIGVLVAGIATSKLLLVYVAIAASAAALVALAIGVVLKREELFARDQQPGPAPTPTATAAVPGPGAASVTFADPAPARGQAQPALATANAGWAANAPSGASAQGSAHWGEPAGRQANQAASWDSWTEREQPAQGAPWRPAAAWLDPNPNPDETRPSQPDTGRGGAQGTVPGGRLSAWDSPETPGSGYPDSRPAAPMPWERQPWEAPWQRSQDAPSAPASSDAGLASWFDVPPVSATRVEPSATRIEPAQTEPAQTERAPAPEADELADLSSLSSDTSGTADEDDDWPTRYSWLDDDAEPAEEQAEAEEPRAAGEPVADPSATRPTPTALLTSVPPPPAAADPAPSEADGAAAADGDEDTAGDIAAEDEPPAEPASAETASGLVTVVPGVPRYHEQDCILIRFMPEKDIQKQSIPDAQAAGCTPCAACQPPE